MNLDIINSPLSSSVRYFLPDTLAITAVSSQLRDRPQTQWLDQVKRHTDDPGRRYRKSRDGQIGTAGDSFAKADPREWKQHKEGEEGVAHNSVHVSNILFEKYLQNFICKNTCFIIVFVSKSKLMTYIYVNYYVSS
jgi:hypothetical protein